MKDGPANWTTIKTNLIEMDQKDMIGLIQELYKLNPLNKNFLLSRFATKQSRETILEEAKEKIRKQFFPARGYGDPKLSVVRQVLREYKKTARDFEGLIDLMLVYLENGTEFTNRFGDMYEGYYSSLISVAEDVCNLLRTPEGRSLYPEIQDRISTLVKNAGGMGWGYSDDMSYYFGELEKEYQEAISEESEE